MNNSYQQWLIAKRADIISTLCIESLPKDDPIPENLVSKILYDFTHGITRYTERYELPRL